MGLTKKIKNDLIVVYQNQGNCCAAKNPHICRKKKDTSQNRDILNFSATLNGCFFLFYSVNLLKNILPTVPAAGSSSPY